MKKLLLIILSALFISQTAFTNDISELEIFARRGSVTKELSIEQIEKIHKNGEENINTADLENENQEDFTDDINSIKLTSSVKIIISDDSDIEQVIAKIKNVSSVEDIVYAEYNDYYILNFNSASDTYYAYPIMKCMEEIEVLEPATDEKFNIETTENIADFNQSDELLSESSAYQNYNIGDTVNIENILSVIYEVNVTEEKLYTFWTEQLNDTSCDTYLELYTDPTGSRIAYNDNYNSNYSQLQYQMAVGTYYLKVRAYKATDYVNCILKSTDVPSIELKMPAGDIITEETFVSITTAGKNLKQLNVYINGSIYKTYSNTTNVSFSVPSYYGGTKSLFVEGIAYDDTVVRSESVSIIQYKTNRLGYLYKIRNTYEAIYRIDITEACDYRFETAECDDEYCDPYMILYNSNFTIMEEVDDYDDLYPILETYLIPGTYYVKLTNLDETEKFYCTFKSIQITPNIIAMESVENAVLTVPVTITATAEYTDYMKLFVNDEYIENSTITGSDFTYTYTPPAAGIYTFRVEAYRISTKEELLSASETRNCNVSQMLPTTVSKTENAALYNALKRNVPSIDSNNDGVIEVNELKNITGMLDLSNCNLTDISGLQCCVNVSRLYINNNALADISVVMFMENLKSLHANNNNITQISALPLKLEFLNVENNDITVMNIHSDRLKVIFAGKNNISDISFAAVCPKLEMLDLCFNNVTNTTPLFYLTNIKMLNLSYNNITELETRTGLLYDLRLNNNQIADRHDVSTLYYSHIFRYFLISDNPMEWYDYYSDTIINAG